MLAHSPFHIVPIGRRLPNPYVIVTPPFTERSAGIRVLHWLCDALNRLGAEAYVATDRALGSPEADAEGGLKVGLATPAYTSEIDARLRAARRTPIVIYPETAMTIHVDGIQVRYLLNYPGLIDSNVARAQPNFVLAYSENLRNDAPGCDQVLFIPGSDPRYWVPDPTARRRRALVYAGKYVEHHRQHLPLHLQGASLIHREGPHAPTRDQLRGMLQGGERLYVLENIAIVAEALLCGCPVVTLFNWFFHDLIAQQELGLSGVASDETPEAFQAAQRSLPLFRTCFQSAVDRYPTALITFAERTQALAAAR